MKKPALVVVFVLGLFGLCASAAAADKDNPTGTWVVKSKYGKLVVVQTVQLEVKDGKVTGTVSGSSPFVRGGFGKTEPTKIEDGTFADGELKFTVTHAEGDTKIAVKYLATITGDTIKGTMTNGKLGGKDRNNDFEGKREK